LNASETVAGYESARLSHVYGVNSIGQVFGTHAGGETWQEFPLPVWFRNVYTIACA